MIRITKHGWRHILKYHTSTQSPTHANKSRFNASEDLVHLIDVGKIPPSKKPTSIVTVITRLNGDPVNMFPGLP